jgi:hypothetical protein
MPSTRTKWAIVILLAALTGGCRTPPPAEEGQDLWTWFDTLDFPDLAKSKLVKVSTGPLAFLVREDDHTFTVLTVDLETITFRKGGPEDGQPPKATYQAQEFAETITALAEQKPPAEEDSVLPRGFGRRLPERAELFVLARASAARGLDELAQRLIAKAKETPAFRQGRIGPDTAFAASLADDIAHTQMWRAVEAFGGTAVPRKELLARFQWIVKHFPQSEHAGRARESAELLQKMVAEDEAHALRPVKPDGELTKRERIAELIFRLRDQHGCQCSQPGSCDIFWEDHFGNLLGKEASPAAQLVDFGYEAVPQLLDVVEDERFTRSVGFCRDFFFSHFVLRVGDCAVAILERIAGRRFWQPRTTSAAMLKDGQSKTAKQAIEAWWQDMQRKGEKQVLIEAVGAGDGNSPSQVERLVAKYPDSAVDALRAGARKAGEDRTRSELVRQAAALKGDLPLAFLGEELRGSSPAARVAAARGLLDHGHEEGIKVMIAEWSRQQDDDTERSDLIDFLLACGKVEAVQALAKELRQRPVGARLHIIDTLESALREWNKEIKDLPPAVQDALDALLAELLDDTEEYRNLSGSWGDKHFRNPRLCDLAGHVLARRWSQPEAFDLNASLKTRDRQRLELTNQWRKKQGQAPLPLPPEKRITPAEDKQVRPLLNKLLAATTAKERREAGKPVLALGLPGLPAVREQLAALPADHPARADVQDLATRLALIVDEVRFAERSAAPTKEFRQQVEALRGQPLTADGVVDLLLTTAKDLPSGATGIQLAIEREGDDTGVTLTVTLTVKKVRQGGSQKGWDFGHDVAIDGNSLGNTSGFASWEHGVTRGCWQDFAASLNKALRAGPAQCLSVRVSIVQGE